MAHPSSTLSGGGAEVKQPEKKCSIEEMERIYVTVSRWALCDFIDACFDLRHNTQHNELAAGFSDTSAFLDQKGHRTQRRTMKLYGLGVLGFVV
jgi:hypothetical protein